MGSQITSTKMPIPAGVLHRWIGTTTVADNDPLAIILAAFLGVRSPELFNQASHHLFTRIKCFKFHPYRKGVEFIKDCCD